MVSWQKKTACGLMRVRGRRACAEKASQQIKWYYNNSATMVTTLIPPKAASSRIATRVTTRARARATFASASASAPASAQARGRRNLRPRPRLRPSTCCYDAVPVAAAPRKKKPNDDNPEAPGVRKAPGFSEANAPQPTPCRPCRKRPPPLSPEEPPPPKKGQQQQQQQQKEEESLDLRDLMERALKSGAYKQVGVQTETPERKKRRRRKEKEDVAVPVSIPAVKQEPVEEEEEEGEALPSSHLAQVKGEPEEEEMEPLAVIRRVDDNHPPSSPDDVTCEVQ